MKKIIPLSVITFIVFLFMSEIVIAKTSTPLLFVESFGFLLFFSPVLVLIAVLIILYYTEHYISKRKLRTEIRNRILLFIMFSPFVLLSVAGHLHYDMGTVSFTSTVPSDKLKIIYSLILAAVMIFPVYFKRRRYFSENIKDGVLLKKKLPTQISNLSIVIILYFSIDIFKEYLNIPHSIISVIPILISAIFIAIFMTEILTYFYITKLEKEFGNPIMSIKENR